MLQQENRFKDITDEYYGNNILAVSDDCHGYCPKCRGEKARVVKRDFLVDHLEASVFGKGPVSAGILSAKVIERKESVCVDRAVDISATDCHLLIMLMWVYCIISINWSDSFLKKSDTKVKNYIVCSF